MNRQAYHRQQRQMAAAQAEYDNMEPPEFYEDDECIDDEQEGYDGIIGEG